MKCGRTFLTLQVLRIVLCAIFATASASGSDNPFHLGRATLDTRTIAAPSLPKHRDYRDGAASACVPHWIMEANCVITNALPLFSLTTREHADAEHAKALCASEVACVGVSSAGLESSVWRLGGDGMGAMTMSVEGAMTWLKATPFCLSLPGRGGFAQKVGGGGRSVRHRPFGRN